MGNFMSCVLICGAVEVVHVVHSDGHVERLIRPLKSGDQQPAKSSKHASSGQQADLMRCLSNLGLRSSSDSSPAGPNSYLLLPIRNADDNSAPSSESGEGFKYKRFSSFQFYKSAFLSPSRSINLKSSTKVRSSKSTPALPAKEKHSQKSHTNAGGSYNVSSHKSQPDDRKQLLRDSQPPFKVKQEGGVTKLVVSKKYLAQLLAESNMKKSGSSSSNGTSIPISTTQASNSSCCSASKHHQQDPQISGAPQSVTPPKSSVQPSSSSSSSGGSHHRVGRPGIWRPALESISETVLIAR